jgi:hypothetical protein
MKLPKEIYLPWYSGAVLVMILIIYLYHQSVDHQRQINNDRPEYQLGMIMLGAEGSENIDKSKALFDGPA